MRAQISYRRGTLDDLAKLDFAEDLAVSPEGIEFNIVGMGHEFWIGVENQTVIGLLALAKSAENQLMAIYLSVANPTRGMASDQHYFGPSWRVIPT